MRNKALPYDEWSKIYLGVHPKYKKGKLVLTQTRHFINDEDNILIPSRYLNSDYVVCLHSEDEVGKFKTLIGVSVRYQLSSFTITLFGKDIFDNLGAQRFEHSEFDYDSEYQYFIPEYKRMIAEAVRLRISTLTIDFRLTQLL